MNMGQDFRRALNEAQDRARRTGLDCYLHCQNGSWWLGKSPLRGAMASTYTQIKPDGTYEERQPEA